jgi:hypothetical protein
MLSKRYIDRSKISYWQVQGNERFFICNAIIKILIIDQRHRHTLNYICEIITSLIIKSIGKKNILSSNPPPFKIGS